MAQCLLHIEYLWKQASPHPDWPLFCCWVPHQKEWFTKVWNFS